MSCDYFLIGGEFDISPFSLNVDFEAHVVAPAFASGRAALRAILRENSSRGLNEIWLPRYVCKTVPDAACIEKFTVKWYEVGPNLHIDFESFTQFPKKPFLIVLIDYFGMLDLSCDVTALHEYGAVVILDKIQALFEKRDFGADYWFYGYRKFLPIPEGAFAWSQSGQIIPSGREGDAGIIKTLAGLVKNMASSYSLRDEAYLRLFRLGEDHLDAQEEIQSTGPLFGFLLSNVDIAKAREARCVNYRILSEMLVNIGIYPFLTTEIPDTAPLAVPIALHDRNRLRKHLISKRIYLPVHWPQEESVGFAGFMNEHELSLVIDQRYGLNDMSRIVETLAEAGARTISYDS